MEKSDGNTYLDIYQNLILNWKEWKCDHQNKRLEEVRNGTGRLISKNQINMRRQNCDEGQGRSNNRNKTN